MNINEAIEHMRKGGKITRDSWSEGLYLTMKKKEDGFESIVDNDGIPYYDSRAEFLVSIIDSLLRERDCWKEAEQKSFLGELISRTAIKETIIARYNQNGGKQILRIIPGEKEVYDKQNRPVLMDRNYFEKKEWFIVP